MKFTTNTLINVIQQTFIGDLLFTGTAFRPANKRKASPVRRSSLLKEELFKGATLNAINFIGVWGT